MEKRKAKEKKTKENREEREFALTLALHQAIGALEKEGWKLITQGTPSIGTRVLLIEHGSTGIHRGVRDEQGRFWIEGELDIYPSRPILWKPL